MSDIILGTLIRSEEQRDAIHIAVAPVIANEALKPGEHIGFCETNGVANVVGKVEKPIGIVDPFLTRNVMPGDHFWMCLYPRSVKNLRHDWSHPSFTAMDAVRKMLGCKESEDFLRAKADEWGFGYEELLDGVAKYQRHGEYLCGADAAEGANITEEFWDHYERATGIKVHKREPFISCAC